MSDSVYAPPKADLTKKIQNADTTEAFYVVSPLKMMVMFITTMGGYQIYWHYKNWRRHQENSASQGGPDGDIWPVPRAVFSFLFLHSLLSKVKQHSIAQQRPTDFDTTLTATIMVVMMLFGMVTLFNTNPQFIMIVTVITLLMVVPLMFMYRKVQRFINEACGDPTGASNAKFTTANYVWMALGVVYWLINIKNIFMLSALVKEI